MEITSKDFFGQTRWQRYSQLTPDQQAEHRRLVSLLRDFVRVLDIIERLASGESAQAVADVTGQSLPRVQAIEAILYVVQPPEDFHFVRSCAIHLDSWWDSLACAIGYYWGSSFAPWDEQELPDAEERERLGLPPLNIPRAADKAKGDEVISSPPVVDSTSISSMWDPEPVTK